MGVSPQARDGEVFKANCGSPFLRIIGVRREPKIVPQIERRRIRRVSETRSLPGRLRGRPVPDRAFGDDTPVHTTHQSRKTVEFRGNPVRSVLIRDSKALLSASTPNPRSGRGIRPATITPPFPIVPVSGSRLRDSPEPWPFENSGREV